MLFCYFDFFFVVFLVKNSVFSRQVEFFMLGSLAEDSCRFCEKMTFFIEVFLAKDLYHFCASLTFSLYIFLQKTRVIFAPS